MDQTLWGRDPETLDNSTAATSWLGRLSSILEAGFRAEALERGRPEVFNINQGSQFTDREFDQVLHDRGVKSQQLRAVARGKLGVLWGSGGTLA